MTFFELLDECEAMAEEILAAEEPYPPFEYDPDMQLSLEGQVNNHMIGYILHQPRYRDII